MQDFKASTAVTHICKPHKPTHSPKLAKECVCPTLEEFQNIFFIALKKLKHPPRKPTMQTPGTNGHDIWTTEKEAHAHNKGLPKAGVTSFYDSFVLNQAFVFQINGSAEMPRLRQAPNRYLQP